eukprot:CAMPEP_0196589294 /NCGR_PEP_ID=MMETSP1081-20130531/63228_1 /TAXON_ID=36882 /ORGANISM="Pyramimonas amylifera, Strain CCMP720" /LENGTH=302 /DNA_ID=CAMNT_0041912057 /DNA_START=244 /DNA_END=1148 /DNA_ORIENTATION=-
MAKKRRPNLPKKVPEPASTEGVPAPGLASQAQTRRILGAHKGLSVRQQLDAVRTFKTLDSKELEAPVIKKSVERTKYRNYKPVEGTEEYKRVMAERRRMGKPLAAISLFGEDGKSLPRVLLLVDGYNVVNFWPRLKKFFQSGQLDQARQRLLTDLGAYSRYRGVEIVCVFDALLGEAPTTKTEKVQAGVVVVYPVNESADSYINMRATEMISQHGPRAKVIVASGDFEIQRHAWGCGAQVCSSLVLIQELKKAKKSAEEKMKDLERESRHGSMLEHQLRPDVRERLSKVVRQHNEVLKQRYL